MSSPCPEYRDRLFDEIDRADAADASLSQHLKECAACAEVAARHRRRIDALRGLPRHTVPTELSGRVVSACHAGYREDRSVAMIRGLTRGFAPAELARKVLDHSDESRSKASSAGAPDALDRRVAEDLADPSGAVARRFASRLARVPAPGALEERVDRSLHERGRGAHTVTRKRPARRAILATAAMLLVSASALLWSRHASESQPHYRFDVRHVTDAASMEPMARSLLSGLSGGLLHGQQTFDDSK